jgi:hypothetical protein
VTPDAASVPAAIGTNTIRAASTGLPFHVTVPETG